MSTAKQQPETKKLPAMLHFLQECTLVDQFILAAEEDDRAAYSIDRMLNLMPDGTPQYCALSKTPPTSCSTPGKMLPGGFTPDGKHKPTRWTPAKTDKRAGQ
jgi:hypothetical protein